jgi:PAS domain S-box-containing protein
MKQNDRYEASLTDEGRYRLLVENITDYAIYMLDPQGRVVSWNAGAQRFKGYTPDEIIGAHFSVFYDDADKAAGLPAIALETAMREGRFEREGWRIRKDGQRFWASVIIDPVRDSSGQLVGFAKITRDLTERRKAEEALKASDRQFRILVQSVTDYAIYMLDPNGFISNWNAGAQRIKGYTPEEIIGQHFSKFYTDEDRATGEPQLALATALREGRYAKEAWRVRKNGERFWASVVLDPIRADDGTILGFAKVTRDITERLEAEQKLEHIREALFQSQKMEAIGQLTGGVAHDFNNLLGAIMGSLELAMKRLDDHDERIKALIANAMEAAKRGAALTQRMLAFARRQHLEAEPIDVRSLVGNMLTLLQRSLGPRIHIDDRVPDGLPVIKADVNQIEMALLNLATNARDAMPDGGALIIEATDEDAPPRGVNIKPGRYVCISVTDEGSGMDEATLGKAMDPFFTTKGVGKGTGLGLSMVKGLAEQSGGILRLASKQGKGTRAELWIPAAPDAAIAKISPEDAVSGEKLRRQKRLSILAVDDDSLILMNTIGMLEDLGHDVLHANSGEQALGILAEHGVDVLITDQAMPHMTGLELITEVRKRWPSIRTIVATGYAELPANSSHKLVKLAKPFLERELKAALDEVRHADGFVRRVRDFIRAGA